MSPEQQAAVAAHVPASPEALEAALAVQRARLVGDVEALAERLAPEALRSMARQSAHAVVVGVRSRAKAMATAKTAQLRARLRPWKDDPLVRTDDGKGARAGATRPPVSGRLTRLVDDARDGDPTSLAIVTGTAAVLAGIGVVAVVKAVRR